MLKTKIALVLKQDNFFNFRAKIKRFWICTPIYGKKTRKPIFF